MPEYDINIRVLVEETKCLRERFDLAGKLIEIQHRIAEYELALMRRQRDVLLEWMEARHPRLADLAPSARREEAMRLMNKMVELAERVEMEYASDEPKGGA